MITVRVASLDEVQGLQHAVLRPNGPLPGDTPPPDTARHVAAILHGATGDQDAVIGAATVLAAPWPGPGELPGPSWCLRSMAVAAEHRGTGVGAQVLAVAEGLAAGSGAASLWAKARVPALGFYARAGWAVVGEEWEKPGVGPHRFVTLRLAPDAPRLRRIVVS